MEEEIKKLREAGFTDSDIQAFVNDQQSRAGQSQPVNPAQVDATQPPMADERVPAYGAPPGTSMMETAGTVGAAVAPYAAGAALTAGGIYGATVAKQGFNAMKAASEARTAQANAAMQQAQGVQNRFDAKAAAEAARAATTAAPSPILDAAGRPMAPAAPVAPAAMPTAQATTAADQALAARVKQTAAQRIAGLAPSMSDLASGAGKVLGGVARVIHQKWCMTRAALTQTLR